MDNEVIIPQESLGVLIFAAKEYSRPIIAGAYIHNGKICCADGFKIAEANVSQGKDFPNAVLDVKDILIAGKDLNGCVSIVYKENQYIAHGKYHVIVTPIIGKFPSYEELCRKANDNMILASIGFQVSELRDIIKSLKLSDCNAITLQFRGNDKPLEFCTGIDSSFKGLIMPYYTEAKAMPWITKDYATKRREQLKQPKKSVGSKVKKAVAFCFKPIIRITIVTDEEKIFLDHAHKFLEHDIIKAEFRKPKGGKDNVKTN